jgi:predicted HicB family RNase H-like nuclease
MAVKTMSATSGGDGKFDDGWHELTIANATYGTYKAPAGDKRYITLNFEGYPDNMDLRIYEVFNKTTNEEFKVANLFKYANAGILNVLQDPTGKKPVIQYDDEASGLVGKKVNVLFYKERKTGKGYTRMFDNIAPVEQEGEHLSYTADQVSGIQKSLEKSLDKMLESTTTNSFASTTVESESTVAGDATIPF